MAYFAETRRLTMIARTADLSRFQRISIFDSHPRTLIRIEAKNLMTHREKSNHRVITIQDFDLLKK